MTVQIRPATAERVPAIAAMLGRAFRDDPIVRWPLLPTKNPAAQIARYFSFVDDVLAPLGMLWEAGEAAGAALWIPPGTRLEEFDAASRPGIHTLTDPGKHDALWSWIESRIPREPLWFLDHIGVDPSRQGRGIGSALVELGLERSRRDGVGAYLETATSENVPYYERMGFRVVEEADVPGGGPHVWFMRFDG
jgi:ribosomal protein S18 acetylase RimI-like enzyme